MKRLSIFFLLFFLMMQSSYASNNIAHQLNTLMEQIKNVRTLLQEHKTAHFGWEKELKKTELAINQSSIQLQKTDQDLTKQNLTLKTLATKQTSLELRIKDQQQVLLQQLKAAHRLGLRKSQMQLLLEGADIEKIERLLVYNRYLTLQSKKIMSGLHDDWQSLKNTQQSIQKENDHLKALQQHQLNEQALLDKNKQHQEQVLKQLGQEVKNHTQHLQVLLKNKKTLEDTLTALAKKHRDTSNYLVKHTGKFSWPTDGILLARFGSAIEESELKQNGVIIRAPEGQNVIAVAPGKVIFSNWMPGYGLLLILDHGKGYMTLYGNNSVLYKKIPDLVGEHELIGKVGHTGGQQTPSLYFALRYMGKAIDPCTWCGTVIPKSSRRSTT